MSEYRHIEKPFFEQLGTLGMLNFTEPNRETAEGEFSSVQFPHPFLIDKRIDGGNLQQLHRLTPT